MRVFSPWVNVTSCITLSLLFVQDVLTWLHHKLQRCPEHLRTEFPPHHNSHTLRKAPLALSVLKRLRATHVVQPILCDQASHLRGPIGWRLRIGHPALSYLLQMTRGDMLDFQACFGKKREKHTQGKGRCMGGVTQILEAVLVGPTGGMFTHHDIFDR